MTMLKRRNIFALLFAVLLALPMMAILGRVVYTQSNKNAKDSYSGSIEYTETIATPLYNTNHLESNNDFIVDNCYLLNFTSYLDDNDSFVTILNDVGENVLEFVSYSNNGYSFGLDYADSKQYDYLIIYTNLTINNNVFLGDNVVDDTSTEIRIINGSGVVDNFIIFKYLGVSNIDILEDDFWTYFSPIPDSLNVWTITNNVIPISTLDNAFEYSVNQFIENNNFGKLNFLQWFESMFFENNQKANLYIRFANWYMNYALLLSLVYVLFLVIMWFINFVRKLLEKGMNFGEGSY